MGKNKTIDRALIMRAANRAARGLKAVGFSWRAAVGVALPLATAALTRRYTVELRNAQDGRRAAPQTLATGLQWRLALIIARGEVGKAKKAGRIASAVIYPDGLRDQPAAAYVYFKSANKIKFTTYKGAHEILNA